MKTVSRKYLYSGVLITFLIIIFTCTTFYEQKEAGTTVIDENTVSLDEQIERINDIAENTIDNIEDAQFDEQRSQDTQDAHYENKEKFEDRKAKRQNSEEESLEEFYKNYTLYKEKHSLPLIEEQTDSNSSLYEDDYTDEANFVPDNNQNRTKGENSKKDNFKRRSYREQEFSKALSAKSTVSLNTLGSTDGTLLSGSSIMDKGNSIESNLKNNYGSVNNPLSDKYSMFENSDYVLDHSVEPLKSPFALFQGSVIRARLITGINSELPGQITAIVTSDIYDSVKGRYLLIPRGTKVIGMYSSDVKMNAQRLFAGFSRLIFPDGSSLNLGAMPGQSLDGYAGIDANVDTHFLKNLLSGFLISTIQSTQEITADEYIYSKDHSSFVKRSSKNFVDNAADSSSKALTESINFSPTLDVEPGFMFSIAITKDIYFKGPYKG
ncbi:TrbI/VirB10 family protein [Succinivibrio sp.]|uniref:TrbI/VirB10 family protein n=1 Tax=Succinivibrio sp. TaxID=2053619 RepID=UPI002590B152|nr:TrbI/VirB10 family protein [Succinivibrio sp.]MDD6206743.1 TrbI/VirB10 family protein [Succinivibrio sp.]